MHGLLPDRRFESVELPALPNVGVKLTAEAVGGWPWRDNLHYGLERPGDGCRSGACEAATAMTQFDVQWFPTIHFTGVHCRSAPTVNGPV